MERPMIAKNVFCVIPSEAELVACAAVAEKKAVARKTIQAAIVRRFNLWQRSLAWYVPAIDRAQALADYIEVCDAIDKADDTYFRLYGERVDNDFQMQTEGKVC